MKYTNEEKQKIQQKPNQSRLNEKEYPKTVVETYVIYESKMNNDVLP